jgi:hypothetical protein
MANNAALRANFDNFLYDMQGQLQRLFARDNVLLAECSGVVQASPSNPVIDYDANYGRYTRAMDGNREHFEGEQVRVPVLTAALQGAGAITESSTWNVPIPIENQKAQAKLAQILVPFALSLALERDSKSGSLSAMSAVQMYTEEAYGALAAIEDAMLNRNGDALLAVNAGADTNGLTVTVTNPSDFDVLVAGTVVDVLVSTTGADPGQGKRRRIASVNTATRVVTFDTTQQASDGGSGNITLTGQTVGLFLAGSYGNAMQGFGQAVTVGGTPFEGIDVASVPRWSAYSARRCGGGPVRHAADAGDVQGSRQRCRLARLRDRSSRRGRQVHRVEDADGVLPAAGGDPPLRLLGDRVPGRRSAVPDRQVDQLAAPEVAADPQGRVPPVRRQRRPGVHRRRRRHLPLLQPADGQGSGPARPRAADDYSAEQPGRDQEPRRAVHPVELTGVSLVTRQTESGLVLAEQAADGAGLRRALKDIDRNLVLWPPDAMSPYWRVLERRGDDRPAETILTWMGMDAAPLPLSSGILDEVQRLRKDARNRGLTVEERNAQLEAAVAKERRDGMDALADEYRPYLERERVGVSMGPKPRGRTGSASGEAASCE